MAAKNIWAIIKGRYRLSAKIQMSFEMGFPEFVIGNCRATANDDHQIKTKKVSLAMKGVVISDTIPLNWFTSSVFIPWKKALDIKVSKDDEHCTLKLNDPGGIIIDLPWSPGFTNYVQENNFFEI